MYIVYQEEELFVTLTNSAESSAGELSTSGQIRWVGSVEQAGQPVAVLGFIEAGGFVHFIDILDEGVQTPQSVLTERLNAYLRDLRQTEQFGIEQTEETEEQESIPYDPEQIAIRRDTYSIFEVLKMINEGDLNLSPDFQRNLVWDNIRKSRLVESVLLGIPLPVFYFAENRDGTFNVVDGLQRLSTLQSFAQNDFALRNLEYLRADCDRRYFKEDPDKNIPTRQVLDKKYTRRIDKAQLVVNVIEAKSPLKVKYDIFKRINEGGRPLNSQEIRNCMATTDTRAYLKEMAHSSFFNEATGGSVNDTRMDAQELVLRFTAFYLQRKGLISDYTGDMNTFLDNTLELLNTRKMSDFIELRKVFKTGMQNAYYLFGPYCFRKCLPEHLKPGATRQLINKSLFTTWSLELSSHEYWVVKRAMKAGGFALIIAEEFKKHDDYYWVVTARTTDRKSLNKAFGHTRSLLTTHLLVPV